VDTVEEKKIACPCWELNHGRPVRSPSLYRLSYPGSVKKAYHVNVVFFSDMTSCSLVAEY
jgi:hypothetical protein